MLDTILKKFSTVIRVKRFNTGGKIVSGKYQDTGYSLYKVEASVQPLKGEEMIDESTARRTENMVKIYTTFEMFTSRQKEAAKADIVIWKDDEYEVQSVEDWQHLGLKHYKVMAKKVINQ